jgi:uncharacterized protein YnzC (UPF0291/DUF896 family)
LTKKIIYDRIDPETEKRKEVNCMENRVSPTIADYIQAGYPALFLPTVEPEVAERRVKDAMMELGMANMEYAIWKITSGLSVGNPNMKSESFQTRQLDLADALKYVEERPKNNPVVAVFHNVRQYITHYNVIQQMQDTILASRLKGSHIILIGPHIDFPPELKTMVTWCDCPLPRKDQLRDQFSNMVEAYKDDLKLPRGEKKDELLNRAASAALGLDSMAAENALALSMSLRETVDPMLIQAQKEQEVKRSDVLEFIHWERDMNVLGGWNLYKNWIKRRRRVFTPEAREYGLRYPKGILFVGPAGSGKSLGCKVTGYFLGLPILRLDMGKVFRSLVGESEAAIRMALQVAEAVAPVLLWIDEIDKGLAGMRGSGELDSGVTARVVSTILTWRQETQAPVMLGATANDVSVLPSMVYRKGRFDEVWATDLPPTGSREEIFNIHLRLRERNPKDFDVEVLARRTPDFVGSEIEACIDDAMTIAFDREQEVDTKHILRAIRETVPQAQRNREEIDAIREWVKTRARLVETTDDAEDVTTAKVRQIRQKPKTGKE